MNLGDTPRDSCQSSQRCIENLKSPNPRQRSLAAQELGQLKVEEAVPILVELLHKDINTYVRSACAEALGHIGISTPIFPLMDALHDHCSFVRRAAAIALGQMQAKEAQGALLQALDDPNFYVRRAAINAIGKLGIADLGPLLVPLLEIPDPRIQRTAITALRRLQTQQAIPRMIAMLEEYVAAPNQRDLPVVKTLVIALGDMHAEAAVPTLIRVVRGYVGVRSLAAMALGQIGDTRAGPVLVEVLSDKSINLKLSALKNLGRLEYRAAGPKVSEFLTSPDPRLRRMAALTSGYLDNKRAIPVLLTMVYKDPSPLVRPAAVEALGALGDARLIGELLPLLDDTNAYVRASLAYTLSALDGNTPEVRQALEQLCHDAVEHVASAAQRALLHCEQRNSEKAGEPSPQPTKKQPSWLKRLFGRT